MDYSSLFSSGLRAAGLPRQRPVSMINIPSSSTSQLPPVRRASSLRRSKRSSVVHPMPTRDLPPIPEAKHIREIRAQTTDSPVLPSTFLPHPSLNIEMNSSQDSLVLDPLEFSLPTPQPRAPPSTPIDPAASLESFLAFSPSDSPVSPYTSRRLRALSMQPPSSKSSTSSRTSRISSNMTAFERHSQWAPTLSPVYSPSETADDAVVEWREVIQQFLQDDHRQFL